MLFQLCSNSFSRLKKIIKEKFCSLSVERKM
jgi:hypothetical protein